MAEAATTGEGSSGRLLEVADLKTHFYVREGLFRNVSGSIKAVDGVSFSLDQGETLGVVGESGCGKTTLGLTIMGSVRSQEATITGNVLFHHESGVVDMNALSTRDLRAARRHIQMVFQDPQSSLNPRMTTRDIIGEPLIIHRLARGRVLDDRVVELMQDVGLDPHYLRRYPYAFSGGQRQRIGIARALALNPSLIVADEPTSALDVSVQAQILNLFQDLQRQHHLSYLFISHNLSVVEHISDRVAVMYLGTIVELAPTEELFSGPRHPYTEALLTAVPDPNPHHRVERVILEGDVPDPGAVREGCSFDPRCRYRAELCQQQTPVLVPAPHAAEHHAACHFAGDLALRGVSSGGQA